jgi:transcriptional regulator with XRE-family HTH domain
MNKKNIGSDFNDFLRDEGIYDEIHATALKEVFAAELRGAMESAGLTEQALAARMGSKGRNTVRRLLDPKNKSATLMVMVQAAHAAGLEMGLSFKKARNTRPRHSFARAAANAGVNADARARARPAHQRPARRSSHSTGPIARAELALGRAGARARPRR